MSSILSHRFEQALLYALEIHRHDLRKGTPSPYFSHLMSVCAIVLENGGTEDQAIAALLHDTLEDHPQQVTPQILAQRFGHNVAQLVQNCTDTPPDYQGGPKPPWLQRKQAYVQHIQTQIYPLCLIPLADKLHNLRSILADYQCLGDDIWTRFQAGKTQQLHYYRSLFHAFKQAQAPPHLLHELDAILSQLEKTISLP